MDKAHKQTDELLEQMEHRLNAIYRRADKEIRAKWDDYMAYVEKRSESLKNAIEKAKTDEELNKAQEEYKRFLRQSIAKSPLSKSSAAIMYKYNKEAVKYTNGNLPEVYALNYNYTGNGLKRNLQDYPFEEITNRDAEDYGMINQNTIDKKKDEKWNAKTFSALALAAVLIGKKAKDIPRYVSSNASKRNKESAYRNSRDTVTDAESKGRIDGMYRAQDMGFDVQKKWIATLDNRTRESHRMLDGKTIPLDDEFLPGLSRPRDPNGAPEEIYNCRCSLGYVVKGYSKGSPERAARDGNVSGSYKKPSSFKGTQTEFINNMNYGEWMKWRYARGR